MKKPVATILLSVMILTAPLRGVSDAYVIPMTAGITANAAITALALTTTAATVYGGYKFYTTSLRVTPPDDPAGPSISLAPPRISPNGDFHATAIAAYVALVDGVPKMVGNVVDATIKSAAWENWVQNHPNSAPTLYKALNDSISSSYTGNFVNVDNTGNSTLTNDGDAQTFRIGKDATVCYDLNRIELTQQGEYYSWNLPPMNFTLVDARFNQYRLELFQRPNPISQKITWQTYYVFTNGILPPLTGGAPSDAQQIERIQEGASLTERDLTNPFAMSELDLLLRDLAANGGLDNGSVSVADLSGSDPVKTLAPPKSTIDAAQAPVVTALGSGNLAARNAQAAAAAQNATAARDYANTLAAEAAADPTNPEKAAAAAAAAAAATALENEASRITQAATEAKTASEENYVQPDSTELKKLNFDKFKELRLNNVWPFTLLTSLVALVSLFLGDGSAPSFSLPVWGQTMTFSLAAFDPLAAIFRYSIAIILTIGIIQYLVAWWRGSDK